MNSKYTRWIALIRAIGPATHKKMSMAQLRDACSRAKLDDVRTVLATGNVVFSSDMPMPDIAGILDGVIKRYDLLNDVFLRQPKDLKAILALNPFPEAAVERPNHMLVLFMATPPTTSEIAAIEKYDGPERVVVNGREAYIDYKVGVARSRLTPARLEKLLSQRGTARNWNTIQKLIEAAAG